MLFQWICHFCCIRQVYVYDFYVCMQLQLYVYVHMYVHTYVPYNTNSGEGNVVYSKNFSESTIPSFVQLVS